MNFDKMAGTAKKMGGQAEMKISRIARDPELGAEGASLASEGAVQQLFGSMRDLVDAGMDYASRALRVSGESTRRSLVTTRDTVAENPIKSVMIAGAAGFLLASFMRARR